MAAGRKEDAPSGPPMPQELEACLEMSGYPFELRVAESLRRAQLEPRFGWRSELDETPGTREIDILVNFHHAYADPARSTSVRVYIEAFIQAKRIPEGAFVGFVDHNADANDFASRRLACGGLPSYGVLGHPYDHHTDTMLRLSRALQQTVNGPKCIQWTVSRRDLKRGGGSFLTDHESGTFDDIETTVKACWRHMYKFHAFACRERIRRVPTFASRSLSSLSMHLSTDTRLSAELSWRWIDWLCLCLSTPFWGSGRASSMW